MREYVIIFFGGLRKTKKLSKKMARYLRQHKYDFSITEVKIRRHKK